VAVAAGSVREEAAFADGDDIDGERTGSDFQTTEPSRASRQRTWRVFALSSAWL